MASNRAAFRVVARLVGASECAAIRVESSQGHRYSFRGNANTAESDNCLSARTLRGFATVCTQSTKLPAVVNVHFKKKWKNAKLPCQVFRLLEFSKSLWRKMEIIAENIQVRVKQRNIITIPSDLLWCLRCDMLSIRLQIGIFLFQDALFNSWKFPFL